MGRLMDVFGAEQPVALVTGSGAPRVGNTIVRALAARGYRCVVHANRSLEEAEATTSELAAQGHESIALQAELTNEAQLHGLIDRAWSRWRRRCCSAASRCWAVCSAGSGAVVEGVAGAVAAGGVPVAAVSASVGFFLQPASASKQAAVITVQCRARKGIRVSGGKDVRTAGGPGRNAAQLSRRRPAA